ncbi:MULTISPECIES: hypothetical protein [Microvirga]|uniref:hypothetical protein n=1 Tax=Microvirga TaxID=186650 RepID=UPI001CFF9CB2|nr:hypothetical protein [Microvirga lenta]MCB5175789.1 hypothetical protein [Microvirga lenta]
MLTNPAHDTNAEERNKEYRTYSPNLQNMMQELLRTLANIDFQHEAEMDKLKHSTTDDELKNYIKEKLLARHRERREPYINLLTELRKQQHRISFAA